MTNILTSLLPRKRLQWQDLRTKKGMFLNRLNEYMPVSAGTQLRLSSHEKTESTYIVSIIGHNEQHNFLYRKKYYRPAFGNEILQCR